MEMKIPTQLFIAIADDKILHVSQNWEPLIINALPEYRNKKKYSMVVVTGEYGITIQNSCSYLPFSQSEIKDLIHASGHPMIQSALINNANLRLSRCDRSTPISTTQPQSTD
jgi:hypothetical protein